MLLTHPVRGSQSWKQLHDPLLQNLLSARNHAQLHCVIIIVREAPEPYAEHSLCTRKIEASTISLAQFIAKTRLLLRDRVKTRQTPEISSSCALAKEFPKNAVPERIKPANVYLERKDPVQRAERLGPGQVGAEQAAPAINLKGERHSIPTAIEHQVWHRDQGQCTARDLTNSRADPRIQ